MKITLLGTSGGIPIPDRAQSGLLVEAEERKILFDCGMGVPLRMAEVGVNAEEVSGIFLTHGHLDHIQDLPTLTKASWLRTDKAEYDIYSPSDVIKDLPDIWKSVREWERTDLTLESLDPGDNIKSGGFDIHAFHTPHTEESQGYVIFEGDKKVVYTGDTSPAESIREISSGADLLIHELSLPMRTGLHTHPEGLIELFRGANINQMVVTHFYPQIEDDIEDRVKKIEKETGIRTTAGKDRIVFEI